MSYISSISGFRNGRGEPLLVDEPFVEQFADPVQAAGQQRFLHLRRLLLDDVHGLDRGAVVAEDVLLLLLDDFADTRLLEV